MTNYMTSFQQFIIMTSWVWVPKFPLTQPEMCVNKNFVNPDTDNFPIAEMDIFNGRGSIMLYSGDNVGRDAV